MRIFVTGFSSSLVKVLLKKVKNVELIPIKNTTDSHSEIMAFDLSSLIGFSNDDFILHAAWNMKNNSIQRSETINVDGSINFFNSLNIDQKKRFIFISSIAASSETSSIYGKQKYEVEKYILSHGGKVIKLGILTDIKTEGLIFLENLQSSTKYLPFMPNFSGKKEIYFLTNKNTLQDYFDTLVVNQASNLQDCFEKNPIDFKRLIRNVLLIRKPIINFPFILGYQVVKLLNIFFSNFPVKPDSFEYIKFMKGK